MVPGAGHVGHMGGERLYLAHELVPDPGALVVHVVGEVPDVQHHVEVATLRLVLQI